jgi:hypothetical protein
MNKVEKYCAETNLMFELKNIGEINLLVENVVPSQS